MRRLLALTATATALSVPLAGPASADHTLCDNESSDINVLGVVGADLNSGGGELFFCVGDVLVVVRTRPGLTVCTSWSNGICPIAQ